MFADSARHWFDGGDLSALARLEECGGTFRNENGEPGDAMAILANHGANCVRLRLFVEPVLGKQSIEVNDLAYTLALAKRAKALDQAILLDLHYSDTFADPHRQKIPDHWQDHSLEALSKRLYEYTTEVLEAFQQAGAFPEMVQLGNEVEGGILWPTGKIKQGSKDVADYRAAAVLFKSAAKAVRDATPKGQRTRIMLHTATGGIVQKTQRFHKAMQHFGVDYDVAGLTYYPWWHGSYDGLVRNMNTLAKDFDLEVMACEIGHTWNERGTNKHWAGKTFRWDKTPEGQAKFLEEIIDAVRDIPDHKGIGVLWWQPDGIKVKGEWVWFQGSVALWDEQGKMLPAIEVFGRY